MRFDSNFKLAIACFAGISLAACGSGGDEVAESAPTPLAVPKVASCASGDSPETALQGQVPAAVRATGFKGYNCNLELVGQFQGDGGGWSAATFSDSTGHRCSYHGTALTSAGRSSIGVPVIDISDATRPQRVTSLTTPAMLDPWESLRINARREILIADNGQNGGGGPEVDIYDLSVDCRSPQLMASLPVGTGADGGLVSVPAPLGHEGGVSPDGLTYYIGDLFHRSYRAVDISNLRAPQMIASFNLADLNLGNFTSSHGLSVSEDGTRMYGMVMGGLDVSTGTSEQGTVAPENAHNGFAIFDTSEVQQRLPNAKIKLISTALFNDGQLAQTTIPIKVKGKPYVVAVDERGSAVKMQDACDAKLSPFPMARIFDISDEAKPTLVSKLLLETHDPANCAQVAPDVAGPGVPTYGSHYCSVDNRANATALACSYFNSGIRVFDIRDPAKPKEIAYYNPAGAVTAVAGSTRVAFGLWQSGAPDYCVSRLDFDLAKKQLVTMCMDNGLIVLQFAPNTWPFAESVASTDQN